MAADSASNDQSTYSLWCGRPSPQTSAKNSQQRTREFRAPLLILYKCMYVTIYILSFLARPTHASSSSLGLFFCRAQLRKIEAAAMLQTLPYFIAAAAVVI